jgi:hypothetical protein
MGCWNETCAITNLPIHCEEDMVVFFTLYHNGEWKLIPVPFYGQYDDYGWFDPDSGQEPKLSVLNTMLSGFEFVKVKSHKPASPFKDFKALENTIHEGNITFKDWENKYTGKIGVIFCHKAAYEKITNHYQDYSEVITVNEFAEHLTPYCNTVKDVVIPPEDQLLAAGIISKAIRSIDVETTNINFLCARVFDVGYDYPNIADCVMNKLITVEETARVFFFKSNMYALRKVIQPNFAHRGSQTSIYKVHSDLVDVMKELIDRENNRLD